MPVLFAVVESQLIVYPPETSRNPLLPVAPDDLVSPGTVPGPIVGGTENWGANLITIPALAFSLNKDQANFRSLIFQHAVSGTKTINMPYLPGKMWLVLNGLSVDSIAFLPPGGGPGSTVAGGRNGIIVMNRLSNGVVVISKMAPDSP